MEQAIWQASGGPMADLLRQQAKLSEVMSRHTSLQTLGQRMTIGSAAAISKSIGSNIPKLGAQVRVHSLGMKPINPLKDAGWSFKANIFPAKSAVSFNPYSESMKRSLAQLSKPIGVSLASRVMEGTTLKSLFAESATYRFPSVSAGSAYSLPKFNTGYAGLPVKFSVSNPLGEARAGIASSWLMNAASERSLAYRHVGLAQKAREEFQVLPELKKSVRKTVQRAGNSTFTPVVDLSIIQEVESIVGDNSLAGELVGVEGFSWESESDIAAFSEVTEGIREENGNDWWAVFVEGVAELWSCRTTLGNGLGTRRSPAQIATLVFLLCGFTAMYFGVDSKSTEQSIIEPAIENVGRNASLLAKRINDLTSVAQVTLTIKVVYFHKIGTEFVEVVESEVRDRWNALPGLLKWLFSGYSFVLLQQAERTTRKKIKSIYRNLADKDGFGQ